MHQNLNAINIPHNFTTFQHKYNQPCCSQDNLSIHIFQQQHNKSNSHPTVHVNSTNFGTNTSTDNVTQLAGSTDRHKLSYNAKGVQIGLFKAGIVTDYYHWLLLFLPVFYLLCLSLSLPASRRTLQSDVSCSKFGIFTLHYSQVRNPSVIVLFCIMP